MTPREWAMKSFHEFWMAPPEMDREDVIESIIARAIKEEREAWMRVCPEWCPHRDHVKERLEQEKK